VAHVSELSLTVQLASLEASLPPLEHKRNQATHLRAVLAGRFPSEADAVDAALNRLQLPVDQLGTQQVRAQRLQDTVALFLALGGGWRGASIEPPGAEHARQPPR
jgi:outer membrane protein TolC